MSETTPRRKIEVLYQDVLGEVGPLVARVETLSKEVDELLNSTKSLPLDLATALHNAASKIDNQTAREVETLMKDLKGVADSTRKNAVFVQAATRKILMWNVLAGGVAGVLGGILAGLALGRYWFVG